MTENRTSALAPGEIKPEAPLFDGITAYDEEHFALYLTLLYASSEGMSEDDMLESILGVDPTGESSSARQALRSHLARARWLSETGYRHLLAS